VHIDVSHPSAVNIVPVGELGSELTFLRYPSGMPSNLTWAALVGLLATSSCATSSASRCDTDKLPPADPCYKKGCCETVPMPVDAGPGVDGGTTQRFCGACNG